MKKVMLTAYDYPTGKIVDEVGVDYILVGDSLAMVVLGHKDTKTVTIEEMLHHTRAVVRATKNSKVIGDMPINTYNTPEDAIKNAKLFMDAGVYAVKIEGNKPEIFQALNNEGIKVMAHLGLLPQTAEQYKVQGKDSQAADKILQDALDVDKFNPIAIVLECIPTSLAKEITEKTSSPTIGIGAGIHCDGQVLVLHDIIGLSDFRGKMVKRYADIKQQINRAVSNFKQDVINEKFPTEEHSFK